MKRLLSITIISQTPRNLSSFCPSKTIFSLPKWNPLRQFNPNPPIPYSFAHCYATCSNSWRSWLLLSNYAALLKGQAKTLSTMDEGLVILLWPVVGIGGGPIRNAEHRCGGTLQWILWFRAYLLLALLFGWYDILKIQNL